MSDSGSVGVSKMTFPLTKLVVISVKKHLLLSSGILCLFNKYNGGRQAQGQ